MKKQMSKLLALMLAGVLTLSGCSGSTSGSTSEEGSSQETTTEESGETSASSENAISDPVIAKLATRELETFNILYSQSFSDFENLTNMIDALLEVDTYGRVVPAIADEWGTEDDGHTWTFHIREGVKWVDVNGNEKADVTSYDFATGMEWVLNYHKNESSHTSQPIEMIEGAEEYYEYTKSLSKEEAYALTADDNSKFQEMVGIKTPDANTIVYTCNGQKPYFDTFATWAGMYPMAQGMVDELGVDGVKAMDNETYWYNGCYLMTSYIQGNEKVFTKNESYWDTECTRFDTVTIKMVESNDVAYQLYQSGEIDYVDLTESNLTTIHNNTDHEYYDYLVELPAQKYSYQMHINFDKNKEDGTPDTNWNTAIANLAFRKSWYYGLDLTEYYKRTNPINPMSCENEYYCMKGLIYTTDGTDYTELVRQELGLPEENGETMTRLDATKAEEYKQQAIEELTAAGVTFPVEVDYYISASNQTSLDSANVLAQCFSDSLGDDYVKLNIKTYVSSATKEVYTPHLQSITINGWGADFGDPQNYLVQEAYGYDNALYSADYSNINNMTETEDNKALFDAYREYTALMEAANAISDDQDARLAAFAKAEAYLIDNVLAMPMYYNVSWCLTKIDPYSKMNAMYGCQNDKMKNWDTNVNGYTTEEIQAIAEEHAQNQ
ncbi:ABC transporter substrate-binding protein [uncultured Negativibacillus sp.]|uniref:peptide ABC transporter substrate-binding protein n=1 Tax=uncultured Negativibacillus sp. TaxID=1980696 RepID=UPI0025E97209|nr:ABC transporter substrate-binding protein [uncultured Negativibacillus sp.]